MEKNWTHSIYVVKPPINLRETSTGKDRMTLLDQNNYNLSLITLGENNLTRGFREKRRDYIFGMSYK